MIAAAYVAQRRQAHVYARRFDQGYTVDRCPKTDLATAFARLHATQVLAAARSSPDVAQRDCCSRGDHRMTAAALPRTPPRTLAREACSTPPRRAEPTTGRARLVVVPRSSRQPFSIAACSDGLRRTRPAHRRVANRSAIVSPSGTSARPASATARASREHAPGACGSRGAPGSSNGKRWSAASPPRNCAAIR